MKLLTACLCLFAMVLPGADLSGIWTGQLSGRYGEIQDVSFKFTQTGSVLIGKMYGESESTPIREGKIEGEQITFIIGNEMNGGQSKFTYTGTIKGSDIEITRKRELPPGEPPNSTRAVPQKFVLKRLL